MRLPTLTWAAVAIGWEALRGVLAGLLLLAVVLWYRKLSDASSGERIVAVILILLGGAMVTQPMLVSQHEMWAGVLLAIGLALRGTERWPLALLAAAAALAMREMALPFVLLALAFALWERRRPETLGWAVLVVAFGFALVFHAMAVNAAVLPSDASSQGWNGFRGPQAVLQDLVDTSLLNRLPGPLAYPLTLLSLLGWAAVPLRQARFALLWFAGYALMLALFARTQNFYWAIVLLPSWLIGLAFLPRALGGMAHAMLAGKPAPR